MKRPERLGWALVVLGLLVVPPAMDSWWLIVPCALLWVGAWWVSIGYGRRVCLCPSCVAGDRRWRP